MRTIVFLAVSVTLAACGGELGTACPDAGAGGDAQVGLDPLHRWCGNATDPDPDNVSEACFDTQADCEQQTPALHGCAARPLWCFAFHAGSVERACFSGVQGLGSCLQASRVMAAGREAPADCFELGTDMRIDPATYPPAADGGADQ